MGVRTGYSEVQLNKVERLFADGNGLCVEVVREPRPIRLPKERTERQKKANRKVVRQKRIIRGVGITFAIVLLVALCVTMLKLTGDNSGLKNDINKLEAQVSELRSQNDSKEYDLNSSVDLNYVVQVATQELGMVRSSAGQIRTYNSSESEYVQQVAEIPTE